MKVILFCSVLLECDKNVLPEMDLEVVMQVTENHFGDTTEELECGKDFSTDLHKN